MSIIRHLPNFWQLWWWRNDGRDSINSRRHQYKVSATRLNVKLVRDSESTVRMFPSDCLLSTKNAAHLLVFVLLLAPLILVRWAPPQFIGINNRCIHEELSIICCAYLPLHCIYNGKTTMFIFMPHVAHPQSTEAGDWCMTIAQQWLQGVAVDICKSTQIGEHPKIW